MSSTVTSNLFQRFGAFLQDHQLSFANCLLVVLTLGGEQAFRNAAFRCPCDQPNAFLYGLSFLIGPSFVLLLVGILVNNLTWKLCQGCAYRPPAARHGFLRASRNWIVIIGRAIVAPAAWVFVALLDGNYYVCLMSNRPCTESSDENTTLRATSQVISWLFLTSVVFTAFVVIICARCTDKLTFHQGNYMALYRATERQVLEEQMKEKVSELANANVQVFLNHAKLSKEDWDTVSMAPLQSVERNNGDDSDLSYTPLHRWAKQHQSQPLVTDSTQKSIGLVQQPQEKRREEMARKPRGKSPDPHSRLSVDFV